MGLVESYESAVSKGNPVQDISQIDPNLEGKLIFVSGPISSDKVSVLMHQSQHIAFLKIPTFMLQVTKVQSMCVHTHACLHLEKCQGGGAL